MTPFSFVVRAEAPASADAEAISWRYYDDIVARYHGRPATRQEIVDAQAGYSGDDLVPPTGLLLLARSAGTVVGCAGMRIRDGGIGEVTRVFVAPEARGRGVARLLMRELERSAREQGLGALRLDTRSDLVEARGLYASLGFVESAPHNTDPYADHWLRRELQ